MARKTDAEIKARREARAQRLAAPVVDPTVTPSDEGTGQQGKVSAEQRLADLRAERLEAMQRLADYKKNHRIEFFKPHLKQARFIRGALNPEKRTLSFVAGNRVGKTEVVAVLTIAFALGRLPWVQRPKPFTFPNPVAVALLDSTVLITHTKATIDRARETWQGIHADPAQAYDGDGKSIPDPENPHVVPPFPGDWQPTPDGERLVGRFPAPARANSSAVASKTQGTYEHLKALLQNPKDPGKLRFDPPVKIRVFGEKTDTLAEVQVPKLLKYIPPDQLALTKKGQTGVIEHFLFKNGSPIDALTYQQDPASMEGWDGHINVYDEPPPRPVYIANVRGLVDHSGIALFSMTPLKEAWIAREVANNPDPSYFTVSASSYDNPHVTRAALDDFFSKLSDDELATRRDGKFLHLQGLVFKSFRKDIHVVKKFPLDKRQFTYYVSIDNHPRIPHAVVFVAVDRKNRAFVVKEIFSHGKPEDIAAWVVDFHDNVAPVHQCLIDRSSQGDVNRGLSTYEIIESRLADAGIPLDFGSKDLSSGIQIMDDALMSRNGIPSLFVCEDCPRWIQEITEWTWDEYKGGADKSVRTPLNKPRDCGDHFMEATRRILQYPAEFVEPRHPSSFGTPFRPLDSEAGY